MKIKKSVVRLVLVAIIAFSIIISPVTIFHGSADIKINTLTLFAGERKIDINGTEYPLEDDVLLYYSNIFIPIDDVLPRCGYSLGWDSSLPAVVAVKDGVTSYIIMDSPVVWVGPDRKEYDLPTMVYNDRLYMSIAMFVDLTGYEIALNGKLEETQFNKRDMLHNTFVNDDYRLPYSDIAYANGVTMAGTFAFERVGIPKESALRYSRLINSIAESLPEVNTYSIVVPTAGEFYAPAQMKLNQTDSIRVIYENLSPDVMPINVVKPLMEHAGEKIYFSTDHHWTQRGAYYAYRAYADNKGFTVPELSEFTAVNSDTHVGSFANFAGKTSVGDKIRANPELLERFMPKVEVTACAYRDMYMTEKLGDVLPVSPSANSYACFIGGDNPLTVMVTNVDNDKKLVIIKESFGNAFSTWALNNYKEVYVVDPRMFNGYDNHNRVFNLREFYNLVKFDDLVIINYPVTVSMTNILNSIELMVK